jgi:molybdopterin-dependent oxidoreductase alpha subunit
MCHEATSVGLPQSIGVGKGTVTLEDFEHCDAIFCIGHNPGTNHPRMLGTLSEASRRGASIIVANPLKERGLERFQDPQRPIEMATATSTPVASAYHQVKVGGDVAMLKGIMKALFEADRTNLEAGGAGLLDRPFIAKHTTGFEGLKADIEASSWDDVVRRSGLTREAIESMARVYWTAKSVIFCYGMGITQHRHGTENVQQLANLMLLRGNIGREGAGICPLRGHSNVQGDRTVGITEIPTEAFLTRMDATFGFISPRGHGHSAVDAIVAMREGKSKGFIGLGGNLAVAISDPEATFAAFRKLDLNVQICTKLNRTCLLTAKETIVLPCLGRTEQDYQGGQLQSVTVEDSMSMVHASRGMLKPSSPDILSEPAIVAGIAVAALPETRVDWNWLIEDYDRIREKIEEVFPDFYDFNERVRRKGGFRLRVGASNREWDTPDGKAHFIAFPGTDENEGKSDTVLTLTTIRSHDQYNTTIYGMNDRYRGVTGRRDVVFVHPDDLALFGLGNGDVIDIVSGDRVFARQTAIAYGIARGSMAAYYPEANCLIALEDYDGKSRTPSYKSVPVTLRAAT